MSEITERLTRAAALAERMVKEKKDLQKRLANLESMLTDIRRENELLRESLIEKEELLHILQTAKSLNSREDKEEAKKKVDDLVREIEHCLKLLDS